MKPWDVLRREAAGLRRSIQYDLIRRAEAQRTIAARRPTEVLDADRARRAFTVTGVSLVLAGGAAGTYLAVAGGLGLFGTDEAATALPIDGPAVVLPAGTPAVPRPHPASPQPVPRSARPARPAGAAAAVVAPPMLAEQPSAPATSAPPSPRPEATTIPSPSPSPSASTSPSPSPSAGATVGGGQPPAGP